jgi:AAA+ ATPase superfamily predicted ATPase
MKIADRLRDIIEEIKRKKAKYILIDGADGSGKSTLAEKIADELNSIHINLDDYLKEGCDSFLDHISYDLLKLKIEDSSFPIIIEGVCVLAVALKLHIKFDLHVYVKKVLNNGSWQDHDQWDVDDPDSFIAQQVAEQLEVWGKFSYPKCTEELIRYHYKFKPHENADFIYERPG